jgi:hypothetical protein
LRSEYSRTILFACGPTVDLPFIEGNFNHRNGQSNSMTREFTPGVYLLWGATLETPEDGQYTLSVNRIAP